MKNSDSLEKKWGWRDGIVDATVVAVVLASFYYDSTKVPAVMWRIPVIRQEYQTKVQLPLEQAVNADTTAEARQGVQHMEAWI